MIKYKNHLEVSKATFQDKQSISSSLSAAALSGDLSNAKFVDFVGVRDERRAIFSVTMGGAGHFIEGLGPDFGALYSSLRPLMIVLDVLLEEADIGSSAFFFFFEVLEVVATFFEVAGFRFRDGFFSGSVS